MASSLTKDLVGPSIARWSQRMKLNLKQRRSEESRQDGFNTENVTRKTHLATLIEAPSPDEGLGVHATGTDTSLLEGASGVFSLRIETIKRVLRMSSVSMPLLRPVGSQVT